LKRLHISGVRKISPSNSIPDGKGTLSYWLMSIPYTPNAHTITAIGNARTKSGQFKNLQKRKTIEAAAQLAEKDVGTISKRDLFMLGLGIYIGEGTKTNDQVRVVNSDPLIIKVVVRWFKEICGLRDENFIARIHAYPNVNISDAQKFWTKTLGIKRIAFHKIQIDTRENKSRKNLQKLPFGTLHLTIRSNGNKEFVVFLARKIAAWISLVMKT
jgi:hypothetical protein